MAALTFSELKKRAGRIETLVRLFAEGHAFESDKSTKKIKLSAIYLTKKGMKPINIPNQKNFEWIISFL